MVLLVTYYPKNGPCRLLLTGDMEAEGEAAFMEQTDAIDVDLLKVAHHGSSGGTGKAFLEWTNPEWGMISCGKKNRYGHPHEQTLTRLEDAGCKWLSTASQGAIIVRITSDGYWVYSNQKQD